MKGENLVVPIVRFRPSEDRSVWPEQMKSDEQGEKSSGEERRHDTYQVHHADAFVVKREKPAQSSFGVRQVVLARGWVTRVFDLIT